MAGSKNPGVFQLFYVLRQHLTFSSYHLLRLPNSLLMKEITKHEKKQIIKCKNKDKRNNKIQKGK